MIREYKRTQGISTTDITDRILNLDEPEFFQINVDKNNSKNQAKKFNLTISKIVQFWENRTVNQWTNSKVIYVTGSFDILHPGHVEFLKEAKKLGDTLVVGLYSDALVNKLKGKCFPLMTIQERLLNLLSLESVDDVLLEAPFFIDEAFMTDFNISIVAEGCRSGNKQPTGDPFEIPKLLNRFKIIEVTSDFTSDTLINRIYSNEETIRSAIQRKKLKQSTYYEFENSKKVKTREL